jgi:hypothetical protein
LALSRRIREGAVPKKNGGPALLSPDNESCLAWLADALQQLRQEEGQTKGVGYLEAVLEEVVFEMKALPRS